MMEGDDDLLNSQKVAELLGVSVDTLGRWQASGRFPQPVRLSRKTVRWHRRTVRAWVNQQGRKRG
jgi:predicted DNA-binding transcriptional regulator AlpA